MNRTTINIGCFGAIRPFKNQLEQAMAAMIFANKHHLKLFFHVNGDRIEQSGEEALKNIRSLFKNSYHDLLEHEWKNHSQFIELVKTMDVGIQVSFSESFNIVSADFTSCGVPIVGSPDIDWLPEAYQANPNSSKDIVEKIERVVHHGFWQIGCPVLKTQKYLENYNKKSQDIWLKNFGQND